MSILGWMILFGLLMSAIALVGASTSLLKEETLQKWLLPLVAFAAGSLIGGALFHMLPGALDAAGNHLTVWAAIAAGFVTFMILEQFLHWHHCHQVTHDHAAPLSWLILIADGLHNFIGGLSIGAVFLIDLRLGISAWIAAAAHEIPQEVADFGVLVHGGLSRKRALLMNLISALTFPIGMVLAWAVHGPIDTSLLVPFGAGNFIYIAAADLIPEVKHEERPAKAVIHILFFLTGLVFLYALAATSHISH